MKPSVFHLRSKRTAFVLIFLTVVVLSLAAGSGTVAAAPEAGVDVAGEPAELIQPGESFTVDVSLTNTGTDNGTVTDIRIKDEPEGVTATDPLPGVSGLAPGETATESIKITVGENVSTGDYSVNAYGAVSGDASTTEPINFSVDSRLPLNVTVDPSEITAGETTNVTVTVTDLDGEPIPTASVTRLATVEYVSVNQSGVAILPLSPSDTGNITLDVTADGYLPTMTNVTVSEETSDLSRFDQGGDNKIGRDDAVKTVVAYNTDSTIGGAEVTRENAVAAIIAYNTGQSIN